MIYVYLVKILEPMQCDIYTLVFFFDLRCETVISSVNYLNKRYYLDILL